MSCATSSTTPACAACKVRRKKCSEKCVLAPYFPPDDIHKFLSVRRVFGNSRVIKLLKDLPVEMRGDAVNSMVYEARERIRDPVFGCVGVINDLQNKVSELQSQLAATRAGVARITEQNANLLSIIYGYHEVSELNSYIPPELNSLVLEGVDPLQLWETLYTV